MSKAFKKSRKIIQENRSSSIALWILSLIIYIRVACIVEVLHAKVIDIQNVVFIDKINILLYTSFSIILLKIESREIGR